MKDERQNNFMNRRKFNKLLMTSVIGGPLMIRSARSDDLIHRNERPTMTYQKLGRTNFMSSRLVFGCGAALVGGKAVRLLDRAFEAGINHFDVGSDVAYKGSEQNLASFLKTNRNQIWVASKAPLYIKLDKPDDSISSEDARKAAKMWTKLLNASLKDLNTDYIDAYYLMGVNNPKVVSSEELYIAFLEAKVAGKVGHFGLSTHKNAQKVLEAAIKTGWYDLAMIGITPAGWYDWTTKGLEKDTLSLIDLQPLLKQAREASIGLIGMKAVRYLAPMSSLGKGDPSAFDEIYDDKLKASSLNPFQRAYAYVLEHGIDVINSDMQNFQHLEENLKAVV
jgi:aryl-alcohol dehydrogenase-like predicted oxidoreductase